MVKDWVSSSHQSASYVRRETYGCGLFINRQSRIELAVGVES